MNGKIKEVLMKRILWITAATALLFAVFAGTGFAQEKPRMGVLRFTNHTSAGWWTGSVGMELSDMLASELVSTRSFQVLDRKDIDAVLGEQDLSDTDRVDAATKVKMGKLKGAKYLVAATVSAFEEDVKGTGGGVSFKGISVGGKKNKAYIAIDLKVIDTETGEIVDTRTIEAEAKGQALAAGLNYKGFSIHGNDYKQTPAGKAIRACVIYISEYLQCSMIRGHDADCMKKWDEMDRKRRERDKGEIDIN
jgi:curli biogenesis system outer membrane secretion channel CsgG